MKAFSELGPIGGAIAGALMTVAGTAQLAVANAERQKVKKMTLQGASAGSAATGARVATGLESGGSIDVEREQDGKRFKAKFEPDRRGYVDRPTVLVGEGPAGHSKEWVASNAAIENPTVAPLIDVIDKAQRTGRHPYARPAQGDDATRTGQWRFRFAARAQQPTAFAYPNNIGHLGS